jgi:beta-phosphoglucomutase-like phosphatase (HAD superfamily)
MASENRALIFDFDGVLADTEPLIWKAWASLLEPYHVPFSWEDYCHFGRGIKDEPMLRRIPQLLANPSLLVKLIDQADTAQQIVQRWVEECPPIPATTIAMFRTLRDFRIGLVTSSQRAEVEPVLQKAGNSRMFSCPGSS